MRHRCTKMSRALLRLTSRCRGPFHLRFYCILRRCRVRLSKVRDGMRTDSPPSLAQATSWASLSLGPSASSIKRFTARRCDKPPLFVLCPVLFHPSRLHPDGRCFPPPPPPPTLTRSLRLPAPPHLPPVPAAPALALAALAPAPARSRGRRAR